MIIVSTTRTLSRTKFKLPILARRGLVFLLRGAITRPMASLSRIHSPLRWRYRVTQQLRLSHVSANLYIPSNSKCSCPSERFMSVAMEWGNNSDPVSYSSFWANWSRDWFGVTLNEGQSWQRPNEWCWWNYKESGVPRS